MHISYILYWYVMDMDSVFVCCLIICYHTI